MLEIYAFRLSNNCSTVYLITNGRDLGTSSENDVVDQPNPVENGLASSNYPVWNHGFRIPCILWTWFQCDLRGTHTSRLDSKPKGEKDNDSCRKVLRPAMVNLSDQSLSIECDNASDICYNRLCRSRGDLVADVADSRLFGCPRRESFIFSGTVLGVLVLRRLSAYRAAMFLAFIIETVDCGMSCWLRNWQLPPQSICVCSRNQCGILSYSAKVSREFARGSFLRGRLGRFLVTAEGSFVGGERECHFEV
jgi:hypothetical protein